MIRYEYQTAIRMSNTMKEDMTNVCEKHKINESDLIRRSIATFVENLNQTPDHQSKYLFV
jgi:predicted DNA-binding protein